MTIACGYLCRKPWRLFKQPLRLHDHLVAAFPAVDEPMQQRFPRTRDATGFVPVILGVMLFEHRLNLEIRLPTDVGRVDVRDADTPLLLGETGDRGAHLARLASQRAGAAGGERPG